MIDLMVSGINGRVKEWFNSIRNKLENSTCPAGNLKTNATCPP